MNKKFTLTLLALLLFALFSYAQKTIRGKVTDASNGTGIPGASVSVKGQTGSAIATNNDGTFTINVPSNNSILVFSYIGYATKEIAVGNQATLNITLSEDAQTLEGVVVTALGIKRSQKSIGYAVQEVKGEDLTMTKDNNVIGSLAGKVAGAQVTGSSGASLGGTQKIKLRGVNSVTGGGQPLIVVDGTPFNNGNFSSSTSNGVDLGNLAQDLNPEDIESVSILKGPAAAALYGSRGQYGAILYTTKKGVKGKTKVDFSSANMIEKVGNFLPMQNLYGAGGTQTFNTFGTSTPLAGQRYIDNYDESWGPKMDGTPVRMYYSFYPQDPRFGQLTPFLPQPDNIKDFYETGLSTNNGINISGGNDNATIRVSYNNTYIKGTYPNTHLKRNNLGLSTSLKIVEKLTAGANLNYANNDALRPAQGYKGSFTGASQWFQRNLDIHELKNYKYADGTIKHWNVNPSTSGATVGTIVNNIPPDWNNPYFDAYENLSYDDRNRFFGDINLSYQVLPELKLTGFIRSDMYVQRLRGYRALGGTGGNIDGYSEGKYQNTENNYEFLAQYNKSFGDISINVNGGGNILTQEYSYLSQSTVGGLSSPGFYNIEASKERPSVSNYLRKKQVRSLYAMASFGYKDIYFIDATVRNDISSALPSNNNSYVYPSVSGSVVFSDLMKWKPLSFGKLRASYAIAGSDLAAYEISPIFVAGATYADGTSIINTMTLPSTLRNQNIKPSFAKSIEIGTELKFFNNRVGADLTYYNQLNEDQIINLTVSGASGYSSTKINAGKIRNKGLELSLNAIPLKSKDFEWNSVLNFAKNTSKIEELHSDVKSLTLDANTYNSTNTVYLYANEGAAFGTLVGQGYDRDPATGKILLNASNYPVMKTNKDFGSVLPDFTGGFRNTFRYKNFDLSVMIDFQKGGQFFSWTQMLSVKSGIAEITAATNDKGVNVRDPLANGGGVKINGIYAPGTMKTINGVPTNVGGQEFTGYVDAKTYYRTYLGNLIYEEWLYDASYVKLRELALGYTLSNKLLSKTPFRNLKISAIARNPLMIWQKAPKGLDPSELSAGSASISWIEKGELQTVRSFGLNLNVSF